MSDEQRSKAALACLSRQLDVPTGEAQSRDEVMPGLRHFVRRIPARRRRKLLQRRAAVLGAVLTSCATATGLWLMRARDPAPFEVEQGPAAARDDARHGYATGATAGAVLRTLRGAHVTLAANTRLSETASEPQRELLELATGYLSVRVPKLAPGATFSVQTPDAMVTVHGTDFSVTVTGEAARSQTCVVVREGLVSVEKSGKRTMVGAGERLDCDAQPAPTPTSSEAGLASSDGSPSAPPISVPRDRRAALPPATSATLAEHATDESLVAQNRLLAAALQAERAGQVAMAQAQLRELLKRYPDSPLRADAERSLARVTHKRP